MKRPLMSFLTAHVFALALAPLTPANAGQATPIGPDTGSCTATSVFNSNSVAGYCNVNGVNVPWFFSGPPTNWQNLKPLQPGRSCTTRFVGANRISGTCDKLLGAVLGKAPVFWPTNNPTSTPQTLNPLPLDTGAELIAATLFGHTAGQSITVLGSTAVLWPYETNGDPIAVSARNDNCRVAGMSNALYNGYPALALNCPHLLAENTATLALYNGSAFELKSLKLPVGANYCEVIGVNSEFQAAGTCYFSNNSSSATFWSAFDAQPKVLPDVSGLPTVAVFLNDTGSVIANALASANKRVVYWPIGASTGQLLPLPQDQDFCDPNDFATGVDSLLMTCAANDPQIPVIDYTWSPLGGLNAIVPVPGATINLAKAISSGAGWAVGHSKTNATAIPRAFISPLP